MRAATDNTIAAELIAVLASVADAAPYVLTIQAGQALPSGPLELVHRSLQAGLRSWVERQTRHPLGYVEQLYTFADRDRGEGGGADAGAGDANGQVRAISVSYLGLTRQGEDEPGWQSWYRYFPWEDRRETTAMVEQAVAPRLLAWADQANVRERRQRCAISFGLLDRPWNEELVLQRYELLYEAGLMPEAYRGAPPPGPPLPGHAMLHDHRRILATAIARLRAKIKYRPVVFELMPETFTMLHLQVAVEALAGRRLHKQNFRRLIEQQDLVEETGHVTAETGGRPAKLFRFRRELVQERQVVGTKLPLSRA